MVIIAQLQAALLSWCQRLPSDTVDVPRNLSTVSFNRLRRSPASKMVTFPLPGRLFKQWLHHANPREFLYPHLAGNSKPVTQDEWLRMNLVIADVMATLGEQALHKRLAPAATLLDLENLLWSAVEELVAVDKTGPGRSNGYFRIPRGRRDP